MAHQIVVEAETPGDFQTTFRLRVDGDVIAENVTELQAQFLASEIFDRTPFAEVGREATTPSRPIKQ